MKIKALRTIVGEYGQIVRNGVAEVSDEIGRQLVAKGYAVAADSKVDEPEPAPVKPLTSDPAPSEPETPKKKAKPNAVDKDS